MVEVSMRARILLVAFAVVAAAQFARADSPSVTAVLSNSEAVVGETVELQIKVTGPGDAQAPEEIPVEGLEIYRTGEDASSEIKFGAGGLRVTRSVTYTYTVLAKSAGTFTIPPQTIRVGNSSLPPTPALTLSVADSPSRAFGSRPGSNKQSMTPTELAFAELVVPKKTAYVGEVIPVVIRVGFFVQGEVVESPVIDTQGLTIEKLQMPERPHIQNINGRQCRLYTFKTAIAATRAGRFQIGPAQVNTVVLAPTPQRPRVRRPHWPPDFPDLDDFFNDPAQQEKLIVKSKPVALEVKPLPPNAPPSFSGAIGNFTMTSDANPKSMQVGDPITITSTISGRGNFDRVNAPVIKDDRGWHKYPPSSKFKQDDEVGISGTKTFETVLSPNEKKQALPVLAFSYFDPAKEGYETLRTDPIPITVEGGAAPPGPSAAAARSAPVPAGLTAAVNATPVPAAKPADILYQLTDLGRARSFAPIYARTPFWIAQLAPLVLLLGFVGWTIRQTRIGDRKRQRIAARQHEVSHLLRELRHGDVSPQVYFSQAARVVHLKTALARNINPNAVDAETVAKTFDLNENERTQLRRLFERSDELSYSGTGNGAETISKDEREEVLRFVENLRV
jgi:hypothetical protein